MTLSWTINALIIGSIVLMIVPIIVCIYKEVKLGDSNDI